MTCGRYGTTRRLSKLNLPLDTKQFLLHVLLVQAASPPPCRLPARLRAMSRSSLHFPLDFLKLNLQLDTKQLLLHVLLVQAASPPLVQAASPSLVPGLIPLLSLLTPLLSGLTSTLTPPILEPSMAPMNVLVDLVELPRKLLLLISNIGAVEILPLHLLGRPMPRRLSTSSTSMMVLLVRARMLVQPQPRFWTACRRCAMEWARSKRHLR